MKRALVTVLSCMILSSASLAQTSSISGFRKNLATVMFAGLGGAVLGLSTLSFYGKPQDHIGNVWTGLTLGVLGGIGYLALSSPPNISSEAYSLHENFRNKPGRKSDATVYPLIVTDF